jgi:hypothetical protein
VTRSFLNRFLPFEAIVGTLLHELVHIVHGPHRRPFKTLLVEITHECECILMQQVVLPSSGACGDVLGGDLIAHQLYTQRELTRYVLPVISRHILNRFAAESRLAVCVSASSAEQTEDVIVLE